MKIIGAVGYVCRAGGIQTEHQGNQCRRGNVYQVANMNVIVCFKYLEPAGHFSKALLLATYRNVLIAL